MLPLLPEATRFVIMFVRDTGARPGEVFALRWEYVDWAGRCYRNPTGKTPAAQRTLLLSDRLMTLLHERHLTADTLASGWVLPSTKTKSGHIEHIAEHAFRRVRKQLGLPSGLVLYSARHDFGTSAMAAIGNVSTVGRWMGHNSAVMTLRYLHPPESESERIRAMIDSRLCTNNVQRVVAIDANERKQSING
jgi:integrase